MFFCKYVIIFQKRLNGNCIAVCGILTTIKDTEKINLKGKVDIDVYGILVIRHTISCFTLRWARSTAAFELCAPGCGYCCRFTIPRRARVKHVHRAISHC